MAAVLALSCKQAAAGFVTPANPAFGSNAANASSWLAGGHAGYNWQQGAAVFGFETDLQATHLNSSMSGGLTHSPPIVPLPASDFASTTALIEYYGTVRGRLGWSAGQWMFFGTAGAAYGNVELSSTFSTLGLRTFSQTSEQKIGWVVGAGFEYLLRPNLMLSLGYQYVDLGRIGISSTTTGHLRSQYCHARPGGHCPCPVPDGDGGNELAVRAGIILAMGGGICRWPRRRCLGQQRRRHLRFVSYSFGYAA